MPPIASSACRSRGGSEAWTPTATIGDVAAFVRLRRWFAEHDVHLLDAIIFTDDYRWWSMHELVTGSTRWLFVLTR